MGFTNRDGKLNEDGRKLVDFIEAQFHAADKKNDVQHLNSLPGMIQHYYVNVYKMKAMEGARWVQEFENSFAASAWEFMEYVEAQAAKDATVVETVDKVGQLTEALAQLQTELAAVRAELAESKAPAKKATSKKKAVKEAEVEETVEEEETDPEEEVDQDAETQPVKAEADETEE